MNLSASASFDRLIINLKKVQSNATFQAVVAVADKEQLAKIDEKSLHTCNLKDDLAIYDSLVRVHESINKLALVQESI